MTLPSKAVVWRLCIAVSILVTIAAIVEVAG